jgi:hypothetical protein
MPVTKYIWDEQNYLAEADGTDTIDVVCTNEPEPYESLETAIMEGYENVTRTDSHKEVELARRSEDNHRVHLAYIVSCVAIGFGGVLVGRLSAPSKSGNNMVDTGGQFQAECLQQRRTSDLLEAFIKPANETSGVTGEVDKPVENNEGVIVGLQGQQIVGVRGVPAGTLQATSLHQQMIELLGERMNDFPRARYELHWSISGGVVALCGKVSSGAVKQQVVEILSSIPGVEQLDVDVEVDPTLSANDTQTE